MVRTQQDSAARAGGRVIVVGAGPAGLATTIALGRQGIEVLLLDRRTSSSTTPKAIGVGLRAMEHLRSWGLEGEIRGAADDVELALLEVERLVDVAVGRRRDINVPTVAQSAVVSPTSSVRIPQDDLERIMLAAATRLPAVTVQRGVEVVDVAQDADVRIETRNVNGGTEWVHGDYLVAADGARSMIRDRLAIGFPGVQEAMIGVSAEFAAPLWEVVGAHRFALYSIGGHILIPAGGGRWQFGQVLESPHDLPGAMAHDQLVERIRAAIGIPDLDVEVHRVGSFRAGAQVATRMRERRILLAGDAAHRVTPRGGNGLTMAIRDGIALGWRLAWLLRDWAGDALLDTYESEMRPVVEHDVARAAAPVGHCHAVITEMLLDLGGRMPHAWAAESASGPVSVLDLLGDGLTLFTTEGCERWVEAAEELGGVPPISVVRLPAPIARGIGINPGGGALLARPDGMPLASWWSTTDAKADLRRARASLLAAEMFV